MALLVYTNARMKQLTLTCDKEEPRLDAWLAGKLPDISRGRIQHLIKGGFVLIDGQVAKKTSRAVPVGAEATVKLPVESVRPEPDSEVRFEVIAQEPGFAIINKPAGLVVHPGSGHKAGTLVNGLLAKYPDIAKVGEDKERPGIVHRLDKDTSGVMVVALNQASFDSLKKQFQNRQVQKTYLAMLEGELGQNRGVIEGKMRRSKQVPVKRELVSTGEGKLSRTEYQVLKRKNGQTLVEARHTSF